MESHAEAGGILIANETYSLVKDWVSAEEQEAITVKGFAKPVRTFRVTGISDDLGEQGPVIRREHSGLSLTIDNNVADKAEAISTLEGVLAELQA